MRGIDFHEWTFGKGTLKTVFFITFFQFTHQALATSYMVPKVSSCLKVKSISESYGFVSSLSRFRLTCDVSVEEVATGNKWRTIYLDKCPKLVGSDPRYIYVKFHVKDGGDFNSFDEIFYQSEEQCKAILDLRAKRIEEFKKIAPGTKISDLVKQGFVIEKSSNADWGLSYAPAFHLTIKTTGEKCGNEVCMDPEMQKFAEIVEIQDFNLGN